MNCQRSLGSSDERSIVAAAGLISVFLWSEKREHEDMDTQTQRDVLSSGILKETLKLG